MNLDDYRKDDGTAISSLKDYNDYLREKQRKRETDQQREAEEIASTMTDDILMDLKNG